MPLTLRPTALSSPAYHDWADYIVREDSRAVGRIYEDRHTLPGLRWFWSITMYVNPKLVQWGHRSGTCQLESVGGDPRRLRPGSRIDIGEGPPEDLLAGQVGFSSQIS